MTATLSLVDAVPPVSAETTTSVGAPNNPPSRRRHLQAHAAVTVIALFSCFPVYWMFVTALRPSGREYDQSPVPFPPSLDSLRYVFDTLPVCGACSATRCSSLQRSRSLSC